MSANVTPQQLAAQVRAILERSPDTRVIGFHSRGGWIGESPLRVDGQQFDIAFCESSLAVRERLAAAEAGDRPLVILTPLGDGELGLDAAARLYRQRLLRIDRWELVRQAFQARDIDPRLPLQGWLADALLDVAPEGGFSPVASGWLDETTVWRVLFERYMGIHESRPDDRALIEWSLDADRVARFATLETELRRGLRARLVQSLGPSGDAMLCALESGHGDRLMAIGLVCEVLFPEGRRTGATLAQAVARLEPLLGGRTLDAEAGRAWLAAARGVLDRLPNEARRERTREAQALLAELRAEAAAAGSALLPAGFQRALADFGRTLAAAGEGRPDAAEVEAAFRRVLAHRESADHPERMDRLRMAVRLVRYLAAPEGDRARKTLERAARQHVAESGFVDWARRYLLGGDANEVLGGALGSLSEKVRERRERGNREFAERFAEWSRRPSPEGELLGIEQILDRVVGPLAATAPVALVVVDGMDWSVARELAEDLRRRGWERWTPPALSGTPAVAGIVPSVTECARASLLAGKVCRGTSANEKAAFSAHPKLVAASRAARPPRLFHKGELTEGGASGLSSEVRAALSDPDQRIVAVVLNAVDDHLAKSDQLRLRWSVAGVRLLDAVIHEARVAGRAVVLTSDHGHVLEADGVRLPGGAEERWRTGEDDVDEHEIVVEGPRVEAACGYDRIVVPWSERVRYGTKKNGYHGGVSPQEVVVPVLVLASRGEAIDGWSPVPADVPNWWDEEEDVSGARAHPSKRPGEETVQASLFDEDREHGEPEWIAALLGSPVYADQRRLAGRMAPAEPMLRRLLAALDGRGDRAPRRVIAEALGQPEFRVRGVLAGTQRVLNVDGYQVLGVDEATGTVHLDRGLLRKQFRLE